MGEMYGAEVPLPQNSSIILCTLHSMSRLRFEAHFN